MTDVLPQGDRKRAAVRAMFDTIAPRYDLVNRLMTFGLDLPWRRRAVRLLGLAPGSVVGDLACGTGDLARLCEAAGHRAVGLDLSSGMLAAARTAAPLVQADGSELPLAGASLDGVVSGFALRNFADLERVLAETARVVRSWGRIAFLDVDTPANPLLGAGHGIWFRQVVPRIGAVLSDRAAYRYLPRSVVYLPPRRELVRMIETAGFTSVEHHALTGGVAQILTATRRGGTR